LKLIRVGPDYESQLSKELAEELKPMTGDVIVIDKALDGVLVRICSYSWDDIFAQKLQMTQKPTALDLSEVSGDDFLF
jgi:hypothetical protein